MAHTCPCVIDLLIQDVCQARFDVAGVAHQCSRGAGHQVGRHRADQCGNYEALKVLERDKVTRELVVECPHCDAPWTLKGAVVTKLEEGVVVNVPCAVCHNNADVSDGALGGYIWEPKG